MTAMSGWLASSTWVGVVDWVSVLVAALHCVLVLFMVWAPFSRNRHALVAHLLLTPFLWLHWLANDDTCALTMLEKQLRGVSDSHSFFYKLVSPVYKVRDADVRVACWVASVALWLVTVAQVGWSDVVAVLTPASPTTTP